MPTRLEEEEARLTPQMRKVRLIGELGLSRAYIAELEGLIAAFLKRWNLRDREQWMEATAALVKRYRHCWAVYLVGKGVFDYRQREYWPHVAQGLGFSHTTFSSTWGELFEKYLTKYGLLRPNLRDTLRFLTPILMHGGIPVSSLGDYFERLLYPALAQPDLALLDTDHLIAAWREEFNNNDSLYFQVDKPIPRFLEYGGDVARDFVDRSLELVRQHAQQGRIPSAAEVGLPQHVVEEYEQWVQRTGSRPPRSTGLRPLAPPFIWLDPWGDGPMVALPGQTLPATSRPVHVTWVIEGGGPVSRRTVRAIRTSAGWETAEEDVPLNGPPAQWSITFDDGRGLTRTWSMTGLGPHTPLLAFADRTSRLLDWRDTLPAEVLWLLYPADRQQRLTVAGGVQLSEVGRLPGPWSAYRLERWDLRRARDVTLSDRRILVQPASMSLRPRLEGGSPSWMLRGRDREPVYVGAAPDLIVPVAGERDPGSLLQRWEFTVRDSHSAVLRRGNLSTLKPEAKCEPDGWRLPMASPRLLGPAACGAFEIHLRGPLGRDTRLPLSIVPTLSITGHEQVRLPADGGELPPVCVRVTTEPSLSLRSVEPEVTVERQAPAGTYCVRVPAGRIRVILQLRSTTRSSPPLELTIPLPALRWSLTEAGLPTGGDEWRTTVLRQPPDWLSTAREPRVIVTIVSASPDLTDLAGCLVVRGPTGEVLQEIRPRAGVGPRLEFPMAAGTDTVRAHGRDGCSLALVIQELPGHDDPVTLPVLYLGEPRPVAPRDVPDQPSGNAVSRGPAPDSPRAPTDDADVAEGQPSVPLRPAVLRFWPLWRPWEQPTSHPLGELDEATALQACAAVLPPGLYRVEGVPAGVSAGAAHRPSSGSPATREVCLGSPEDCLAYLEGRPLDLTGWLERLLASIKGWDLRQPLPSFELVFESDHVSHCLETFLLLAEQPQFASNLIDSPRPGLRAICDALRAARLKLLTAVAERQPTLNKHESAALRQVLVALGMMDLADAEYDGEASISDADLAAVWAFWPALRLTVEPSGSRANQALPDESVRRHGLPAAGADVEGLEAWLASRTVDAAFGGRLTDGDFRASEDDLSSAINHLCKAVPDVTQIFNTSHRHLLTMTWLLTLTRDTTRRRSALAWQKRHLGEMVVAVEKLRRCLPEIRPLLARLERRYDPQWKEKPGNIPFMVGTTALVLRSLARWPDAQLLLSTTGRNWRQPALRALDIAPEIFTHDLCLMDLALSRCDTIQRNAYRELTASA